jgi:hypothetical protein
MLLVTGDGTMTGFFLANPKLLGERGQARHMLARQSAKLALEQARGVDLVRRHLEDHPAVRTDRRGKVVPGVLA